MTPHPGICTKPLNDGRDWVCHCARCGSSADWMECEYCDGEGFYGHDCGEDCCVCEFPEDNVPCQVCNGDGGWWTCLSSADWCKAHPLPKREDVPRGVIEWFPTPK